MANTKIHSTINPQINLTRYSLDMIEEYELDSESNPWLQNLLEELEEDTDSDTLPSKGQLTINAQITRKLDTHFKDHLVTRVQLKSNFHLPCGRCLHPLPQELDLNFGLAFIHETFDKLPEYAELTSIYTDGEEMELYFLNKGQADLQECIHEQVFLEVEPFPRCEGECVNPVLF